MAIQEVDWKEPDRGPKHNLFELQAGRADRSRAVIEQAMRLSPRDPNHWGSLAILARTPIALAEIEAAFAPRSKNRYLSLKKMPKTFSHRAFVSCVVAKTNAIPIY